MRDLDELLRESDFVSLHTNLSAGDAAPHRCRRARADEADGHARSTPSRGPVVDQEALVDALRQGQILGAALDVTEPEPMPADHPLLSLPNCLGRAAHRVRHARDARPDGGDGGAQPARRRPWGAAAEPGQPGRPSAALTAERVAGWAGEGRMPPLAVALALTAAFFHATWNLLLARARDKNAAIGVAMVFGPIVVLPIALFDWHFEAGAIPYALFSALLELAYFAMLAWSYQRAELSLIYPIARGLAPVFVLILGAVLLGSAPSQVQALGILIVGMGVILVRGLRAPASLVDVLAAVGIAVLIASYTLVDQQGLQYADPISYLVVVVLLPGAVYAGGSPHAGACRGCGPPPRPLFSSGAGRGRCLWPGACGTDPRPRRIGCRGSRGEHRDRHSARGLVLHERQPVPLTGAIVVVAGIALVVAG